MQAIKPQHQPQHLAEYLGTFTPRGLVDLLFTAAGPRLHRADLLTIINGGAEYLENASRHAAELAEGVGCLVAHDGNGSGAGSFQSPEGTAALMWHMQAHLQALEATACAIGWAGGYLKERGEA